MGNSKVDCMTLPSQNQFNFQRSQSLVLAFTFQLAHLLKGHVPLLKSLQILHKNFTKTSLATVIQLLIAAVNCGNTLSEALRLQSHLFSSAYIAIVHSGEKASSLSEALWHMGKLMEHSERFYKKLRNSLIYPVIVLNVGMVLVIGIVIFIIPQFEQLFQDISDKPNFPWLTQKLFQLSHYLQHSYLLISFVAAGLLIGLLSLSKKESLRLHSDKMLFKVPYFGSLYLRGSLVRMSRTLHLLLTNKILLTEALSLTMHTVQNRYLKMIWKQVIVNVQQGSTLATSLAYQPLIPSAFTEIIYQGEMTGTTPSACKLAADLFEEAVEHQLLTFTTWLEPLLVIFLALFIGSIIFALFLPLMALVESVNFI
jgi:type IV pilus assembly protein PilC